MLRRRMLRRPPLLLLLQLLLLLLDFYSLCRGPTRRSQSVAVQAVHSGIGSFIALVPLRTVILLAFFEGEAGRRVILHHAAVPQATACWPHFAIQIARARWLTSRGTTIGARDSLLCLFCFRVLLRICFPFRACSYF